MWERSVEVLRMLTELGYGTDERLVLDLAYNPPLGELTSSQSEVAEEFRAALGPLGVRFDSLLSLPNMPLGRYRDRLAAREAYRDYVDELSAAFNPSVASSLECRHGLDIAWDGTLWDCDFNLAARVRPSAGPLTLAEALADPAALLERRIGFGPHCFACTAGAGFG